MAEKRTAGTPRPRGDGWLCIRAGLARDLHEQRRVVKYLSSWRSLARLLGEMMTLRTQRQEPNLGARFRYEISHAMVLQKRARGSLQHHGVAVDHRGPRFQLLNSELQLMDFSLVFIGLAPYELAGLMPSGEQI
jgi:hypothetical protein